MSTFSETKFKTNDLDEKAVLCYLLTSKFVGNKPKRNRGELATFNVTGCFGLGELKEHIPSEDVLQQEFADLDRQVEELLKSA